MSSPEVWGPYLALAVFLAGALAAVGRELRRTPEIDKVLALARVSLAVPIAVFGAEHLASPQTILKIVPAWMPGKLFWTYLVGAALLAAAISLTVRVRMRLAATLLGILLFCFVATIHLPNALAAPGSRILWTIVARDSGFGAGAVLLGLAGVARKRTAGERRAAAAALYWIALVTIFFGIEGLLHPQCVPAVPLAKTTPPWIPAAHFWTVLTGIALAAGGAALPVRKFSRQAGAALGVWVVALVATVYLAMMIAQRDIEGLNYFADTLMYGGVLLAASRGYEVSEGEVR